MIGKELHDNINQILASTKLYLDMARSHEEMRENMIHLSRRNILEAMDEIRTLSHSLVAKRKQQFDLDHEVDHVISTFSTAHDIKVQYSSKGNVDSLPEDMQLTLFRIIREAFTNISKYAHATEVWVKLEVFNSVFLTIKDDGKGFGPCGTWNGIGINNMKQRAEFYNGSAKIKSALNKGCIIEITLPLQYQKMVV